MNNTTKKVILPAEQAAQWKLEHQINEIAKHWNITLDELYGNVETDLTYQLIMARRDLLEAMEGAIEANAALEAYISNYPAEFAALEAKYMDELAARAARADYYTFGTIGLAVLIIAAVVVKKIKKNKTNRRK